VRSSSTNPDPNSESGPQLHKSKTDLYTRSRLKIYLSSARILDHISKRASSNALKMNSQPQIRCG